MEYHVSSDAEAEKKLREVFTSSEDSPLSIVAVKTTHPVHGAEIGKLIKRILDETNHRVGRDVVINQKDGERYFIGVGYDHKHAVEFAETLRGRLNAINLRVAGPMVYSPVEHIFKFPGFNASKAMITFSYCLDDLRKDADARRKEQSIAMLEERAYGNKPLKEAV